MSVELEAKCKERREARVEALGSGNNQTRAKYRQLNREVKAAVRRAKRQELEDIIEQMEEDLRGTTAIISLEWLGSWRQVLGSMSMQSKIKTEISSARMKRGDGAMERAF